MTLTRDPNCTLCRLHADADFVCLLGKGPEPCDVMIIGEAPGKREDDSGKPFVGKSGQYLESVLEQFGFSRKNVFITNAVSCRPPENRTPTKGEVNKCKKWLDYQISMIKPKFVLLLGNTPLLSITGKQGITSKRGRPFEKDGMVFLPAFHPSFVLRDPSNEAVFENDIKLFREIVDFGGIPESEDLDFHTVLTPEDFELMLEDLEGVVAFDIETNALYPWQEYQIKRDKNGHETKTYNPAKIVSVGFGTKTAQWVIPFAHSQSPWDEDEIRDMVDRITERIDDCYLVAHNGKFDLLWMRVHFGVNWRLDFDTMLAHYLLDENDRHGLKYLAMKYCGAPDWEIELSEKQGETPLNRLAKYNGHDVYYTRELKKIFSRQLKKDKQVKEVFDKVLMPCARLYIEVEFDGVYIDETKFDEAEAVLREQYNGALEELKEWEPAPKVDKRGREVPFNWGSPMQLAKLLFEDLGIKPLDKTKTGAPSCSESVIKRIDHPCTAALLRFRAAKQQLSFFIDGWKPYIHRKPNGDTYLHPSFKLHGTVTGRLSCENPNLQQVPRDKRIRSLITAPEGWTFLDCDLSQIELRIAAELANERAMIDAFERNIDVHWKTALSEIERGAGLKDLVIDTASKWAKRKVRYSEAFDLLMEMGPDEAIKIRGEWKEFRKKAKAVNFGYLYGMWWKKFIIYARDNYGVEVTDKQAEESRTNFFDTYSDLPNWHKRQKRHARKYGFVRSLSGRKRRLPAAQSAQDTPERREAERQAINSPVQSFANELNLMAALQLRKEYSRRIVKICGTVHDSILLRVRNDYVEEVYNRLLEIMRHPELLDDFDIKLAVPIEADGEIGPWGMGVPLEEWKEAA